MGRQANNQFGFPDCSPCFPCEVCVMFNSFEFRKCYPKGMDPNLREYHTMTTKELKEHLQND